MASISAKHRTWKQSFQDRAELPNTPPLSVYLFRLMAAKRTNLCLSADVQSTAQLLEVAEECGDSICVFKTHADIVKDFGERTIKGLREIAARKKFLIFEDRKFGDIGSTVQAQYGAGPHHIADWASIVNAHVFPGPAIITALQATATAAIAAYSFSSTTEITGGRDEGYFGANASEAGSSDTVSAPHDAPLASEPDIEERSAALASRKGSVVSISTTISSSTEYLSPPAPGTGQSSPSPGTPRPRAHSTAGELPLARGLLLLAQMSSADNLFTPQYTDACVAMAQQHRDFVMGYIAQQSLNALPDDNFLTMTPGVNLPPLTAAPLQKGDGLGQQYNSPKHVILQKGCDIAIVGRGILGAEDKGAEAERYRKEAWSAYLERIGAPADPVRRKR